MENILKSAGRIYEELVSKKDLLDVKLSEVDGTIEELKSREFSIATKEKDLNEREAAVVGIEDVVELEKNSKIAIAEANSSVMDMERKKQSFELNVDAKNAEITEALRAATTEKLKYEKMVADLSIEFKKLKEDRENMRSNIAKNIANLV